MLGHHTALLAMIKGLPLTYNKDLQEDKQALGAASTPRSQCTVGTTSSVTRAGALRLARHGASRPQDHLRRASDAAASGGAHARRATASSPAPASRGVRGARSPLELRTGALNSFMLATDLSE